MAKRIMAKRKIEKTKELSEQIKFFICVLCLVVIACSLTTIFYYLVCVEKIIEYDMYLIVGNKIGFDVSREYVHFGIVRPGGSSTKSIVLSNNDTNEFKIQIKMYGELANFVNFDLGRPIIKPNETKEVYFSAVVPENARYGNYTGKLQIIFRRF